MYGGGGYFSNTTGSRLSRRKRFSPGVCWISLCPFQPWQVGSLNLPYEPHLPGPLDFILCRVNDRRPSWAVHRPQQMGAPLGVALTCASLLRSSYFWNPYFLPSCTFLRKQSCSWTKIISRPVSLDTGLFQASLPQPFSPSHGILSAQRWSTCPGAPLHPALLWAPLSLAQLDWAALPPHSSGIYANLLQTGLLFLCCLGMKIC